MKVLFHVRPVLETPFWAFSGVMAYGAVAGDPTCAQMVLVNMNGTWHCHFSRLLINVGLVKKLSCVRRKYFFYIWKSEELPPTCFTGCLEKDDTTELQACCERQRTQLCLFQTFETFALFLTFLIGLLDGFAKR